jgi:putative transposase
VRRSLGWVPINTGAAQWKNGQVYYNGHYYKVWDSYGLNQYKFRTASFSEDARGRGYFNVVVEVESKASTGAATDSNGFRVTGRRSADVR